MKPVLCTIKPEGQGRLPNGVSRSDGETARGLPPEMEGRPDAAELRSFILTFHSIDNAEDRRAIMEAVFLAATGER